MLPRITGLAELMPAYLPRGSHSALGYWLPHNVRYDTVHRLLYGVFPKTAEDLEDNYRVVSTIDIYEARTLRKLKTMQETVDEKDYLTAKVPLNTAFSDSAYFAADGNTIYD